MKILYAIQGTGNGHLSRARDIVPALKKNHEIDILISGSQADLEIPFEIKYKLNGLGFIFGRRGGIDLIKTYKKNKLNSFFAEVKKLPVEDYDLVINDFEPVSAWACFLRSKTCISLSHQAAVLNKYAPQPKHNDPMGYTILKKYAPVSKNYGFHFKPYDKSIFTPVIRQQVRQTLVLNKGHYTVYLPAYDDARIIKVLELFPDVRWEVFSKHNKQPLVKNNITVSPIVNDAFIQSMATAEGVLCGAGFETPAEALFMNKKLLVVPMKGQYEQQCNAAALKDMGIDVIKSMKAKHADKIKKWLEHGKPVPVDYPDETEQVVNMVLDEFVKRAQTEITTAKTFSSRKAFRKMVVKNLIRKL